MVYLTHSRDYSSRYRNLMIIIRSHKDILTGVMDSFNTHEHAHMHTCTHPYRYCMLSNISLPLPGCRGTHYRDEVSHNCHKVAKDCFIEVVGQWLSHEDGTGDNPRTWETVFTKKKLLSLLKGIWQKDISIVKCYAVVSSHMYIRVHTYIHDLHKDMHGMLYCTHVQ